MKYDIAHMGILEWCAVYEGPLFHALLCDPPYHLTDQRDPRRSYQQRDGGINAATIAARESGGFMGMKWDGGRIAFEPETWAALGRLLHPGAFGMAFASTRGFHRMAVAIEDAGFIIHPMICWNFASGFPKATRISNQVDDQWARENYGGWCECED